MEPLCPEGVRIFNKYREHQASATVDFLWLLQSAHLVDLRQFYGTTAAGALAAPLARFGRAWTSLCGVTGASLAQQQAWADHELIRCAMVVDP